MDCQVAQWELCLRDGERTLGDKLMLGESYQLWRCIVNWEFPNCSDHLDLLLSTGCYCSWTTVHLSVRRYSGAAVDHKQLSRIDGASESFHAAQSTTRATKMTALYLIFCLMATGKTCFIGSPQVFINGDWRDALRTGALRQAFHSGVNRGAADVLQCYNPLLLTVAN